MGIGEGVVIMGSCGNVAPGPGQQLAGGPEPDFVYLLSLGC